MRVRSLQMQNFRSFIDSGEIQLDQINVLIGANNSGKTSVLRALNMLQEGVSGPYADVRVGSGSSKIYIVLDDVDHSVGWGVSVGQTKQAMCTLTINSPDRKSGNEKFLVKIDNNTSSHNKLRAFEPNHFIVPYLSKRKTSGYQEDVREQHVLSVENNMVNLAAKLSRLSNPNFPAFERYAAACNEILGFVVTSIPSPNGQRPGVYLPDLSTVPIDQMGEGVPNIVHMLASLAVSDGKLFVVEEPENDLHPTALKALLRLMVESSDRNQFVVSTHSNIVASYLCSSVHSKLFRISSLPSVLPTEARVEVIDNTPAARISVLRELGYAFSDFDLWDGWLILEESSAERIIRDYLIPWFVPRLSRVRTIAAGGVSKVEATFDDLNRLVLFTHMQPAYKDKAWVIVDGDPPGAELIQKLKQKYGSWHDQQLMTFERVNFECYYPEVFSDRVEALNAIDDRQVLRVEKTKLLSDVMAWLDEDSSARDALEISANEVIRKLRVIEGCLLD